jgi:hypothetical protein
MRALVLVLLLAACERHTLIAMPDAGGLPDAGTPDAGPPPDAGLPNEPAPGGECDQQDDCAACMYCSYAPFQTCNGIALACEENAACLALSSCVSTCITEACVEGCAAIHSGGVDLFVAFYDCMLCDACPADCRDRQATWCDGPPL